MYKHTLFATFNVRFLTWYYYYYYVCTLIIVIIVMHRVDVLIFIILNFTEKGSSFRPVLYKILKMRYCLSNK